MAKDPGISIRLDVLSAERKLLTSVRSKLMNDRHDITTLLAMFDQFFRFQPSRIDGHNIWEDNDPKWPSDDSDPKKETEAKFTDRMESKLHLEHGTLSEHFTRPDDPATPKNDSGFAEIKSKLRHNIAQVDAIQMELDGMQAEIDDLQTIQQNEPVPSKK